MVMSPTEGNVWLSLIAVMSYIAGSLPSAYLVTKGMTGKDIRFEGSRNVGTMNAYGVIKSNRSRGLAIGGLILTFVGDAGKGALAIFVARWLSFLGYNSAIALILASSLAILGHNYPLCFKFKQGGRGVATLMGVLLALDKPLLGIWGGTLLVSMFAAQYVLGRKMSWNSFSEVFSVIGSQVAGRVAGMGIALVPLYFFDTKVFLPALAATILVLASHIIRVKGHIREWANPKSGIPSG
jgi:glycerol-3-phosphate acyltransferase PlsY